VTESGAVRGAWLKHVTADGKTTRHAVFRGIPFAAAPVGALRFAAPEPPAPWHGERDASEFGPTPQRISPYNPPRVPEPSIPGAETLNVNITTPDPSASAQLPVLVWIHGGGFIGGSPASPWYVGEAFARDGVVTVTVSYRLGFEGFGWLTDAGRDGVVNNRGVRDWLASLEWVKRNISRFGGDPARVTIGGQSAGGAAVMRLLSMPSAQHLFSGVLAISPADASSPQEATALATARIAAAVGAEPTAASASRIDENALFAARDAAEEPRDPATPRQIFKDAPLELGPCVDGEVCEASVSDGVAAGMGSDKPLLIGSTAHEFTMMLLPNADALDGLDPEPLLVAAGASPALAREFVEHSRVTGDLDRGTAWVIGQGITDVIFRAPVAHWSGLRGEAPGGTWTYDFRWESRSPDVAGAAHCVDIPFGMDMLNAERVEEALGADPPQSLADAVHGDWLALITSRDVAAPQHGSERNTVIYGADASRSIGRAYDLEARVWEDIRGRR
jgi:para-nitrobenzyl esterase